ncbi:MAG: hypothetical protein P8K80_04660 [Phycisphaerales bacterium]|nr:hypothetical protein [Phycisphaerales bacterium]
MPENDNNQLDCQCGYNRQGLDEDAVCPECGLLELRPKGYPRTPVARAM